MKTSVILIALIFLNTSAIIAEPIMQIISGINTWVLLGIEILLLIVYVAHTYVKDVNEKCALTTKNLRLFVVKDKSA